MTDAVKGKTLGETRRRFEQFLALVTDDSAMVDDALAGKLAILADMRDYPTRVKCASLAWQTLRAAVEDRQDLVSTERITPLAYTPGNAADHNIPNRGDASPPVPRHRHR